MNRKSDRKEEAERQLYLMTAYLTDEDKMLLRIFCEERGIQLEFIEE